VTPDSKIFVAGHRGMVGSAIVRALASQGFSQILTRPRAELDLLDRSAVRAFFEKERPDFVIDAASRVVGIV
jgi:GDP-L-fucose synthase